MDKNWLGCRNTLMLLSEDKTNHEYMTRSKKRALDFDQIKTGYTQEYKMSESGITSVDALICDDETDVKRSNTCFVEFKNGDFKSADVMEKAKDSLLIFCDLVKCTVSDTRSKSTFVLVCNPDKKKPQPSREEIHRHSAKRAGHRYASFTLTPLFLFFSDVLTLTQHEFDDFLIARYGEAGSGLAKR